MAFDLPTIFNYALAVLPLFITCLAYFIRIESRFSVVKNDIEWIKLKTLERRKFDIACPLKKED